MRSVLYMVQYGVDSRHLFESLGTFNKLKEAKAAYEGVSTGHPFKAKRLTRLSFPDKWSGANDVRVVREVVA